MTSPIAAFHRITLGNFPPKYALQGSVCRTVGHLYTGASAGTLTFLPIVGEGQTVIPWPVTVRTTGPGGLGTIG